MDGQALGLPVFFNLLNVNRYNIKIYKTIEKVIPVNHTCFTIIENHLDTNVFK